MRKLEVFDPPMCCKSGICGSNADSTLVTFASDLEWLKKQGVEVERHGLALEPDKFSKNEIVKEVLNKYGNASLPIIVVENKLAFKSSYPSREELAKICKVDFNEDEAPPIHREENCCCGVDCDCSSSVSPEGIINKECSCSSAPAEDNCYCQQESTYGQEQQNNNFFAFLFKIVILAIFGLILWRIFLGGG